MEFENVGAGGVLISLSKDELSAYGLTFETLDYENHATRALVSLLLARAADTTGRCFFQTVPLRIDALPDGEGGCVFLFSQQGEAEAEAPCAFISEDIFAFIDAARACGASSGGQLFQTAKTLVLLVDSCTEAQRHILEEYLRPLSLGRLSRARLEETARCLIEKDALKILRGARA